MSRLLFGRGACGPLIIDLQRALEQKGFDPRGSDGRFGHDTASAVMAFQTAAARTPTGEVSDDDWIAVTGTPAPDIEARCLQLTSTFEGHGYTLAEGNWDGAWLTWGIVGFTLAHGEVQAIIRKAGQVAPHCVQDAFGANAQTLLDIIDASAEEQEAWAQSITAGVGLQEPWRAGFAAFGGFREVQALQRARAHEDYFVPAVQTAAALGLVSELGLALCFDIHVQNGGVGKSIRQFLANRVPGVAESAVRESLANAVANHARPEFREDVRARKLAIARGSGLVHGSAVVLRRWGLDPSIPALVAS
jgi:peptidoglycan hydrolase-like protein with peptidoglycan-binding domain